MHKLNDQYEEWNFVRSAKSVEELVNVDFQNQFFKCLKSVFLSQEASVGDKCSAMRDALLSAKQIIEEPTLHGFQEIDAKDLNTWGLEEDKFRRKIKLKSDFIKAPWELNANLEAAYGLEKKRFINEYPIDPTLSKELEKVGINSFMGAGQRDAIRVTLLTEGENTFLINLPTGIGKTLILNTLYLKEKSRGTILVVVPTIALAIDQSRRFRSFVESIYGEAESEYALYSGLDKVVRDELFQKIRSGDQGVIFTSPESLMGGLRSSVISLAKEGKLSSVIIDEAHLVAEWGVDFRPEFQGLSGLVKAIRTRDKVKKVKVVLLSATYNKDTIDTLSALFKSENEIIRVHGSFLRPEISYSTCKVSYFDWQESVLDAYKKLPKPMIIYTNTPGEAEHIHRSIRESLKVDRIRTFTGKTDAIARQDVLEKWNASEIECVVGTSAFGVGVDKPNIRSIMHASVPENINRFYQDVGRSGRDGRASQSLVIFHQEQLASARRLNQKKRITAALGYERFVHMWKSGEKVDGGRRLISARVLPLHLRRQSETNEDWNWITLMQMQRAGIISIEVDEKKINDLEEFNDGSSVIITPLIDDLLDQEAWSRLFNNSRQKEETFQNKSFNDLENWLINPTKVKICNLLSDAYVVDGITPQSICTRCPVCAEVKSDYIEQKVGNHSFIKNSQNKAADFFEGHNLITVYHEFGEDISWIKNLKSTFQILLERNIIDGFRTSKGILSKVKRVLPRGMNKFWYFEELTENWTMNSMFSEMVILPYSTQSYPRIGWLDMPKIVIAPHELTSSLNSYRKWIDDDSHSIHIEDFISRVKNVSNK